MTAALKLERDPIDEVITILEHALMTARMVPRKHGEIRAQSVRIIHTLTAAAADRAFALIPRPPVAVAPGHEWLRKLVARGVVHAFPRDESGTYERSVCGAITKRRGMWLKSSWRRCKNCARMVAG